eukprot:scaffold5122_cov120-Isochrysis_galbana.AAC.9
MPPISSSLWWVGWLWLRTGCAPGGRGGRRLLAVIDGEAAAQTAVHDGGDLTSVFISVSVPHTVLAHILTEHPGRLGARCYPPGGIGPPGFVAPGDRAVRDRSGRLTAVQVGREEKRTNF